MCLLAAVLAQTLPLSRAGAPVAPGAVGLAAAIPAPTGPAAPTPHAEAEPATPRPAEAKPAAPRPAEAEPATPRPGQAKPAAPRPAEAEPAERAAPVPAVELTLTREAPVGRRVAVSGAVVPRPRAGTAVVLQRRAAGQWTAVQTLRTGTAGRFRTTVRHTQAGVYAYRAALARGPASAPARVTAVRVHTYVVRTRGDFPSAVREFAASAAATYADPRGWARGFHRFRRVGSGGDFTLVLAAASAVPSYGRVCDAAYSCRSGRYVVINEARWRGGSRPFPGPLRQYRRMVLNHETGHWLGLGHVGCPRAGALAPVMQQQSKGLAGCRPNAWPLDREVRRVAG
nr:DUF3152 domain-containing protein [Motilibacter deserti]